MDTKPDATPLSLELTVHRDGDYMHINGYVRKDTYGAIADSDSLPYGHAFGNLKITSQIGRGTDHLYGWEVSIENHGRVDLREAQDIVAVLGPIQKKLSKLDQVEGNTQSFGQWVNRVCRVLKVEHVSLRDNITLKSDERPRRPQSRTPGDAVYIVDQCVRRVVEMMTA